MDEDQFQQHATQIGSNIRKVQQNVSSMQRMINQLALNHGEDQSVKQQLWVWLIASFKIIYDTFFTCDFFLITFLSHRLRVDTQQLIQDADYSLNNLNSGSLRHLKLQRERLLDEFGSAINVFQEVQRKYVDQEKKFVREVKEHRHGMWPKQGVMGDDFNNDNSGDLGFASQDIGSVQRQQEEIDLRALEEQERAIRELEENIANVNEIYKKLGALVYEQGTVIDSIEASVEDTATFVQEGAQQLQQAGRYRVRSSSFS